MQSDKMEMNYTNAVKNLFSNRYKKAAKTPYDVLRQKPKGWIYIPNRKNRNAYNPAIMYYDNRSAGELEYLKSKREDDRLATLAATFQDRFLSTIELELLRQDILLFSLLKEHSNKFYLTKHYLIA